MKSFFIKLITIKIIALITLSFYFLNLDETYAAINQQINYQGRLLDDIGDSVTDGGYDIEFALYTVSTGGSPVWTETQTATTREGLFSVMLGSVSSLAGVDFNQTLYLGINVEGDGEMTPRKVIGAVPAAFEADKLDGISSEQFFRNDIVNSTSSSNTFFTLVQNGAGKLMELFGSGMKSLFTVLSNGNVGIGTTSPSTLLEISGSNPILTFDNTDSSSHDYQLIVRGGVGQPNRFDIYNRTTGTTMLSMDNQMFMVGTTSNPIGNSSRMFVWGGPAGANIDVMGEYASGRDQAVLELQSGDFASSFQSSAFRHYGSLALGSTLGFNNNSGLGVLDFTGVTAIIKTTFDDPIIFGIDDSEVMRISGSGNLGIGTTTPDEKLSVSGNINLTGALKSNGDAGVSGYILQTTGTGVQWVATSSLGITGGLTSYGIGDAVTSGTGGSILYVDGSGNLAESNANLRYDSVTGQLYLVDNNGTILVGDNSISSSLSLSSIIGRNNQITGDSGTQLVTVVGNSNNILGYGGSGLSNSTVVGSQNNMEGVFDGNQVFGYNNTLYYAGTNSVFGLGNNITDSTSNVFGAVNTVSGNMANAFGYSNTAINYSSAFGYFNFAQNNSLAMGNQSSANNLSMALGFNSTASAFFSTAVGYKTTANATGASVFGGGGYDNVLINNIANSTMIGPHATSTIHILGTTGEVKLPYITASSTTATSTLPNLQTTNINVSGRLYDVSSSAGANGYILQTTGTGVQWVATSSLGIAGMGIGNTVSGGTTGSILFVNSSGNLDQNNSQFNWNNTNNTLSLGTSTSPSSSRLNVAGGNITHTATGDPTLKGTYNSIVNSLDVYVSGRYAYVANGPDGLEIIDIADPASPNHVGTYGTSGSAENVHVVGKYAYVADGTPGFHIIDISNTASPSLVSTYNTSGYAQGVYVSGKYAYVADGNAGLQIIDIASSTAPVLVGTYDTGGSALRVYVSGKYAYVADYNGGLNIIDISNPSSPSSVSAYNPGGEAIDVYVSGKYAYMAFGTDGLEIVDISNPSSPSWVGAYNPGGDVFSVHVVGKYAYIANTNLGLSILDISNPSSPSYVGSYDTSGYAQGVYVSGKYAYVADGSEGVQIVDINGLETPAITTGAIETDNLTVNNNVSIAGDLYASGGLVAGSSGILSQGSITSSEYINALNTYLSDNYLNFTNTLGDSGYGIRNNSGTLQFKNSSGNWQDFASTNDIATSSAPVAFSAHRNGTTQTVTVNNYVRIDFTHEYFDTNNNFDLTNDRFTPTVAGYYQINAGVYCNSSTSCFIGIFKNGSTQATNMIAGAGGSGSASPDTSTIVYMNGTTDYIHAFVYSSNASVSGSINYTHFSGMLVSGDGNGGTFNQAANYSPTGIWDFSNATVYGLGSGSGGGDKRAIIVDEKTQGTGGGTFTAGAWRVRDLNTELQDSIGVTVSSNEFTLPAGNYNIYVSAPAYNVERHRIRLYNVTDGTVVAYGTSAYARSGGNAVQSNSEISHNFTITSSKTFRVEHGNEVTGTTLGFGVASNFTGAPEIYTVVDLTQLGAGDSLFTPVGSDAYYSATGSIGIGTQTPQRLLHVYRSDDGPPVRFQDSNGYCEINPTSTTWTCTSDERLKENIVSIASTTSELYDKMRLLRPVTFEWKTDESNTARIGLIAQEVEAIFPEFVQTDEETGLKTVSYGSFIPYIISMLQHIANRMDELVGNALHFADGIITKLTIGSSEKPTGITMFDEVTGEAYCLTIRNGDVYTKFGECPFEEDENSNPQPLIYSTSVEEDDSQDIFFGNPDETEESTTTPDLTPEENSENSEDSQSEPEQSSETEPEPEVVSEPEPIPEPVQEPEPTPEPVSNEDNSSNVIVETVPSSGSVEINL